MGRSLAAKACSPASGRKAKGCSWTGCEPRKTAFRWLSAPVASSAWKVTSRPSPMPTRRWSTPASRTRATDRGIVSPGSASQCPSAAPCSGNTFTSRVQRPAAQRSSLAWRQAISPPKHHLPATEKAAPPGEAAGCSCRRNSSSLPRPSSAPPGAEVATCTRAPPGGAHWATGSGTSRHTARRPARVTCNTKPCASQQSRVSSPCARPEAGCSASSVPSALSARMRTPATKPRASAPAEFAPTALPSAHMPSTPPKPSSEPTSLMPMPMRTRRRLPVWP
mmetsp:Transcript_107598/g.347232  ORF Transcript_107598/g.347232 Transcript_107598/m.347232 type:complete len:279 (+) Transcript_107598:1007-1843(+)